MKKNLKNIRRVDNTKVALISDDSSVKDEFLKNFDGVFKDLKFISSNETLKIKSFANIDILILDIDMKDDKFEQLYKSLQKSASFTQKIVIASEDSEANISRAVNLKAYAYLLRPCNPSNIKLSILMCINQTKRSDKIELTQGLYFDEYRDQFFRKDGTVIDFTRLEKSFLKLLIERKDEITNYETIKDIVWKGKNMSIYTMRNIVNKIRQKTNYEIIKNHSSRGYTISIAKS